MDNTEYQSDQPQQSIDVIMRSNFHKRKDHPLQTTSKSSGVYLKFRAHTHKKTINPVTTQHQITEKKQNILINILLTELNYERHSDQIETLKLPKYED